MRLPILPLFIVVPIAEILLLIEIGKQVGVLATVALVLSTAVIGVSLLKRQGLSVLAQAQAALDRGEMPVQPVADGACLLVAGAFLLTPGLITDTAGFLLLVPRFRRWLSSTVMRKLMATGHVVVTGSGAPGGGASGGGAPGGPGYPSGDRLGGSSDGRSSDSPSDRGKVIETEYHEIEPGKDTSGADSDKPRDTPWNRGK